MSEVEDGRWLRGGVGSKTGDDVAEVRRGTIRPVLIEIYTV